MPRVPAVPSTARRPRELDDLELLASGALAPLDRLQRARLARDPDPARPAWRGQDRRAGRPRGPAARPGHRRRRGRGAHPRPARPVPPAPPDARRGARAARRRARSCRSSTRSPRRELARLAAGAGPAGAAGADRPRHPRALPGRAAAGHPGRGRPAARRRRGRRTAGRRTATPTSTTSSASRSSRRTPAATRCSPSATPTATTPTTSPPSSTPTGPAPTQQGLVLFFTGLSGSGKSTVAQAVIDSLLEQGERTVTSLDGDVVRRNLSAGLTFCREDRETNIRRIGWVAAEISRHGGVAVCSPIAPFDATRQDVRAMADAAGGAFFLVHVATPLEECERRDRKGLYAKARRGEIPDFTGISSPYEEPEDADLRIDTTGRTIDDCRDEVLARASPSAASSQRGRVGRPDAGRPDPRPLRLYGEHLPLAVPRAPRAAARSAPTPGSRSAAPAPTASTTGRSATRWRRSSPAGHRDRRRSAAGRLTGELIDAGRPGAHRRGAPTAPSSWRSSPAAFRKIFTLGQFVETARRRRPVVARPRRCSRRSASAAARRPRARHRRPLPAWPRGGRRQPSPWRHARGALTVARRLARTDRRSRHRLAHLPWKDRAHG